MATQARARPAAGIGAGLGQTPHEFDDIYEVQVGDLEDRNDDAAIETFDEIYSAGISAISRVHARRGDRPRCSTGSSRSSPNYGYSISTTMTGWTTSWVVSHGAAIRLVAAVLAGVDGLFAVDHHLTMPRPWC